MLWGSFCCRSITKLYTSCLCSFKLLSSLPLQNRSSSSPEQVMNMSSLRAWLLVRWHKRVVIWRGLHYDDPFLLFALFLSLDLEYCRKISTNVRSDSSVLHCLVWSTVKLYWSAADRNGERLLFGYFKFCDGIVKDEFGNQRGSEGARYVHYSRRLKGCSSFSKSQRDAKWWCKVLPGSDDRRWRRKE